MATTYNTAFGSLPGYNEMLGTTNTTGGGQQQVYGQRAQQQRQQQQPAQTFAQMQRQGVARPAPPQAPQAQPFAQYGGSQQAQQMRQRLQSQLEQFGQAPSRFDTQAFQQIRGAQAANLQQEYRGQQQALNEELARRGLSASSVGGGRMGDLAGQQARALASLDAELLQRAAETQAQDRAQLLSEGRGLAELASSQDLAQFEANRVAQAATFENQLRAAQFGQQQFEQAGQEAFQGAQAEEAAQQAARAFDLQAIGQAAGLSMDLQRLLGQQEIERAGLTGQLGGMQTLAGRQFGEQQRQFDIQQALQQQLGLGGLDVQRGQLGLEQQRITNQATQFGLQLNEQQAQRLQQGGFTAQELALEAQKVGNQAAQFGQTLSAQERQNAALNNLEQQKITDDRAFRAQQLGLNGRELDLRATQIQNEFAQRGQQITNDQAYREAELGLRTTQIQNEFTRSGQQIGVEQARIQAQRDISAADNAAQMSRLEKQVTSQAQLQTQELQARAGESALERQLRQALQSQQLMEQGRQFNLEQALRQQLGLSELTGVVQPLGGFAGGAAATAPAAGQPSPLAGRFGTGVVAPGDAALASAYNMGIAPTQQLPYLNYGMGGIGGGGGMQTLAAQQQALQRAQILAQMTGKAYGLDAYGNVVQTGGETLESQRVGIERTAAEAQQKLAAQNMFTQLVSTLAPFLPTSTTAATQSLAEYMKDLMGTIRPTGGGSTGGTGGTGGDGGDRNTFIPSSTNTTGRFGLSLIPSSTAGAVTPSATTSLASGALPSASTPTFTPAASSIQQVLQQSPSLQALNARLAALPVNERSKYLPVESLLPQFMQGMMVPEEAQPGTVFNNYSVGPTGTTYGNTFMGYDGTGFLPLTRRAVSTAGGGTGYQYFTATGQRWA